MEFIDNATPLNADNMNKGNWRDDKSVSYDSLNNNTLPAASGKTQIVTKQNGEVYVVPPSAGEAAFKLSKMGPAFFRMEVRNDGNLYLITPSETNPLHINQNGELILTV